MFYAVEGPAVGYRVHRPQQLATVSAGHGGVFLLLHLVYNPKAMCSQVGSTGGYGIFSREIQGKLEAGGKYGHMFHPTNTKWW